MPNARVPTGIRTVFGVSKMQATKRCPRCGKVKSHAEFYIRKSGKQIGQPMSYCKPCLDQCNRDRLKSHPGYGKERAHARGENRPVEEAKNTASWLGVYVAEQILSRIFDNICKMPVNNPGYDFVCGKGFMIDAKSSCLHISTGRTPRWLFHICRNEAPDYFLCLGFNDDRDNLMPLHIWLIPAKVVNSRVGLTITNSKAGLAGWAKYERPVDKVITCCNEMKAATPI